MIATGPGWTLHCGDYREVLADVVCDAVIADPPLPRATWDGSRHCDGVVALRAH